jgi:hypothetical protein
LSKEKQMERPNFTSTKPQSNTTMQL